DDVNKVVGRYPDIARPIETRWWSFPLRDEPTIAGYLLHPVIAHVRNIDVAFAVDGNPVWFLELLQVSPRRAEHRKENSQRRKLLDAVVIRIGDQYIAGVVRRNPTREIELSTAGPFASLEHRDRRNLQEKRVKARGIGPLQL